MRLKLNDLLELLLKLNKMEENQNNSLTFEQKLEGWKNRMAFARTVARIIAVIIQTVITYFLITK